jgi:SAM-dependent methyltransferase
MEVIRNYGDYEKYLDHQKEKSLDPKRVKKWQNEEWEPKIKMFTGIFESNKEFLKEGGKALGICARTGQEIIALKSLGMDAIGVDIVAYPPLVIEGDAHDLQFEDGEFDFVFTNSFDHSIYPDKFLSEMQRVLKSGGYGLIHLQLTDKVDDYTENIIVDAQPVKDLLVESEVVKEGGLTKSCYNKEIVFKKR